MLISGRCHCGNISFALDWRPEPSEIPARACTCSFCAKHGGVWTSCPTGSLTVSVKDRARLSKYAFDGLALECSDLIRRLLLRSFEQ